MSCRYLHLKKNIWIVLFSSVKILILYSAESTFKCFFMCYLNSVCLSSVTATFDRFEPSTQCRVLGEKFLGSAGEHTEVTSFCGGGYCGLFPWISQGGGQGWKHTPLPPRLILPQALSQPQSSPACPAPGQQCTVHSTLVVQSPHDWGERHDATTRQFEECCLLWMFLS